MSWMNCDELVRVIGARRREGGGVTFAYTVCIRYLYKFIRLLKVYKWTSAVRIIASVLYISV